MRKLWRPNIAFAGLTAAGKTTHAKILAEQLGYEWISATALLLEILGMTGRDPTTIWFTEYERIQQARDDDRIDTELERRLGALACAKDGLILDTWAMASIYEGPLIRIWLESDEESRARKCLVSQGGIKALDLNACRQLVRAKDTRVRTQFSRRLHFDLFTDRQQYDALLTNTALIPEATDQCARAGIRTFAPVVHDVVCYLIDQARHRASNVSVARLQATYGTLIQRVSARPWSCP
jgi:cytidylate kinase